MAKKKIVQKVTYEKGTQIGDFTELRSILDDEDTKVYLRDQTIWNDDTESITIEINFKHIYNEGDDSVSDQDSKIN